MEHDTRLRVLLFALSLALLALLGAAGYQEYARPWRRYQKQYASLSAQPSDPPGLRQIWIPDLNRADRCVTCHLGVEEPAMKGAPAPFNAHPDPETHPFENFGCTLCHRGDGLAVDAPDARSGAHEGMLSRAHIYASCLACHSRQIPEQAEPLRTGRTIVRDLGCRACHAIGRGPDPPKPGPDLAKRIPRLNRDWVIEFLTKPHKIRPGHRAVMPDFKLSAQQARDIAALLFSNASKSGVPPSGGPPGRPADPPDLIDAGRALVEKAGCLSCHSIGKDRDARAPDLAAAVERFTPAGLLAQLRHPGRPTPAMALRMPDFRFSEGESSAIAAYLHSRQAPRGTPARSSAQGSPKRGERLVRKFGCVLCHDIAGLQSQKRIGPPLTHEGAKRLYEFSFENLDIPKSKAAWLFKKLKDPRAQSPEALKMPDFRLSDEDATAATTYLLALTNWTPPARYVPSAPLKPESSPAERGRAHFQNLHCLGCHRVGTEGGTAGPELSYIGSKLNAGWLRSFLGEPHRIRWAKDGVRPLARMPHVGLSAAEAAQLEAHLVTLTDDERFPARTIGSGEVKLEDILEGHKLYKSYACYGCHTLHGQGHKIGPELTHVGARIRPGYMFRWLKNPKAVLPKTAMKNFGLWDDEAEALVNFLQTKR